MTLYCYALYDSEACEFSLIQSHVNDDIAVHEFVRQMIDFVIDHNLLNLTMQSSFNPFVWKDGVFKINADFVTRFSIYRLGIFDTSTGLLDGSVECVNLSGKLAEVLISYRDYYNTIEYYKNLKVGENDEG